MPQNRRVYLLVGGFVLICLAGLIGLLLVIEGRTGNTVAYYTVYRNVAGLKFGTPVFFEGYLAGQVEHIAPIEIDGRPRFRVELSIDSSLEIPTGSVALIVQPNLLSGRAISVSAGESNGMIEHGGTIAPGEVTGLAALPDLVGSGQSLMTESEQLVRQGTTTLATIETLIARDLRELTEAYRGLPKSLSAEVAAISSAVRQVLASAQQVADRAAALLDERNVANVAKALANIESASAQLATASADIASVAKQIDNFMVDNKPDLEGSIVELRHILGSVSGRVDAISDNMEDTSRNMREFSRQIRLNPGLLLGGTPPVDEANAAE